MRIKPFSFLLIFFIPVVMLLGAAGWSNPEALTPMQQITPTAASVMPPATPDSWIIVDLPPDASQLEYGTEVYRLVCKACHGDKGQGLTDDWRAQWEPSDQNCWQSKCHALNHPPDGFYMPQVPGVVGGIIRGFGTADKLYYYIHNFMPWQDRGSMTERESWSVTAYILKINGLDPGSELNAETAARVDLNLIPVDPDPPSPAVQASPAARDDPVPTHENIAQDEQKKDDPSAQPWLAALVLLIALFVLVMYRLRRHSA